MFQGNRPDIAFNVAASCLALSHLDLQKSGGRRPHRVLLTPGNITYMPEKIFGNFAFDLLDSTDFREDSVREELITPLLQKLGYSAYGENKIIRSKRLEH